MCSNFAGGCDSRFFFKVTHSVEIIYVIYFGEVYKKKHFVYKEKEILLSTISPISEVWSTPWTTPNFQFTGGQGMKNTDSYLLYSIVHKNKPNYFINKGYPTNTNM